MFQKQKFNKLACHVNSMPTEKNPHNRMYAKGYTKTYYYFIQRK